MEWDDRSYQALMRLLGYGQRQRRNNPQFGDPSRGGATVWGGNNIQTNPGMVVGPAYNQFQQTGEHYPTRQEQGEWAKTGIEPWNDEVAYQQNQQQSADKKYFARQDLDWNNYIAARGRIDEADFRDDAKSWGKPAVLPFNRPENYHSGAGTGSGNAYYGPGASGALLSKDVPVSADEKSNWFAPRAQRTMDLAEQYQQPYVDKQIAERRQQMYPDRYADYVPAPGGAQPTAGVPELQKLGQGVSRFMTPAPAADQVPSMADDELIKILQALMNYRQPAEMPVGGYGLGDVPYQGGMSPYDVIFGD